MARLAVVSYPALDQAAIDWIASIRARHDPQANRIPPHFTLVFPLDASLVDMTADLTRVSVRHAPVTFVIRSARAIPDVVHGGGHVFVVPEEGRDQIARLHDALYAGVLRPHLREDVAFVPHLTVAVHADMRWCESYAEELNGKLQAMHGVLESVTLVDVSAAKIVSVAEFALRTQA